MAKLRPPAPVRPNYSATAIEVADASRRLEDCPFCGSHVYLRPRTHPGFAHATDYLIVHRPQAPRGCPYANPKNQLAFESPKLALARWNHRSDTRRDRT